MDEIKMTHPKMHPKIIILPNLGSIGNRAKIFPSGVN